MSTQPPPPLTREQKHTLIARWLITTCGVEQTAAGRMAIQAAPYIKAIPGYITSWDFTYIFETVSNNRGCIVLRKRPRLRLKTIPMPGWSPP